MNSPT